MLLYAYGLYSMHSSNYKINQSSVESIKLNRLYWKAKHVLDKDKMSSIWFKIYERMVRKSLFNTEFNLDEYLNYWKFNDTELRKLLKLQEEVEKSNQDNWCQKDEDKYSNVLKHLNDKYS